MLIAIIIGIYLITCIINTVLFNHSRQNRDVESITLAILTYTPVLHIPVMICMVINLVLQKLKLK